MVVQSVWLCKCGGVGRPFEAPPFPSYAVLAHLRRCPWRGLPIFVPARGAPMRGRAATEAYIASQGSVQDPVFDPARHTNWGAGVPRWELQAWAAQWLRREASPGFPDRVGQSPSSHALSGMFKYVCVYPRMRLVSWS